MRICQPPEALNTLHDTETRVICPHDKLSTCVPFSERRDNANSVSAASCVVDGFLMKLSFCIVGVLCCVNMDVENHSL